MDDRELTRRSRDRVLVGEGSRESTPALDWDSYCFPLVLVKYK